MVQVCRGKTATIEVKITRGDPDALSVSWEENVGENVNYDIGPGGRYIKLYNALPVHTGWYHAFLKRKFDGVLLDFRSIYLRVEGKINVPCPFKRKKLEL